MPKHQYNCVQVHRSFSEESIKRLQSYGISSTSSKLTDTYYDTADFQLYKDGITLRVRDDTSCWKHTEYKNNGIEEVWEVKDIEFILKLLRTKLNSKENVYKVTGFESMKGWATIRTTRLEFNFEQFAIRFDCCDLGTKGYYNVAELYFPAPLPHETKMKELIEFWTRELGLDDRVPRKSARALQLKQLDENTEPIPQNEKVTTSNDFLLHKYDPIVSWEADLRGWKMQLFGRTQFFMNNWDGYHAEALNCKHMEEYFDLLQRIFEELQNRSVAYKELLSVDPQPEGSLLLEWKTTEDRSLLLEVNSDEIVVTDVSENDETPFTFGTDEIAGLCSLIVEKFA